MTSQVQGKGSALIVLLTFLLITGPSLSFSAEDMWSSVFEYQQKMAGYGNPEAQVKLGEMYEEGHGTEQDFDKARQWYQKAASQGYAPAKKKLSKLEARRKQVVEERRREERERVAQKELERVRAEQKKADDAGLAQHNRSDRGQQSRPESSARKPPSESAGKKQPPALSKEEKAKREAEARKRAQEAIKKMMAVPSAYSED